MKLGIVTYNIAANWDLDTILRVGADVGLAGVELRTGHAHGVEVGLDDRARAEVHAKFADSPVALVGLGSTFEYHAADPAELHRNIAGTKAYVRLAAAVGARGVKVRPNGLPKEVPEEKTLDQIGRALNEVAADAADCGVEIRLEVHGRDTCHVPRLARIMAVADHPNAKVCWNSNFPADLDADGRLAPHFALLAKRIGLVHINRLHCGYPYRELFALLRESGYQGFCLAEIPAAGEVEPASELLRYYRAHFAALGGE
ncbi:MAG: sugar phosphate isomerase/epimerase family protein [Lentisphaeria bacterium]|jgi:sugar phosphate isomerase/epimerase|nr:sugar phosphate isomerase/epimerase family protein [Lentisphaeria bacterium]